MTERILQRADSMYSRRRVIDWTRKEFSSNVSGYIAALREHDWASTPIGAMAGWPACLRQTLVSAMSNKEPRLVLWGSRHIILYNEAFVPLLGKPSFDNATTRMDGLGQPFRESLPSLWDQLAPMVDFAMLEGQVSRLSQLQVTLHRHGYPEDTFWYLNLLPVLGEDGCAAGVLAELSECTPVVIGERRSALTHQLRKDAAEAEDLPAIWQITLRVLESNADDIPFAIMYSVGDENAQPNRNPTSRPDFKHSPSFLWRASESSTCRLEGTVRVPSDTDALYRSFDYQDENHPLSRAFKEASNSRQIVHLSQKAQNQVFPEAFKHESFKHAFSEHSSEDPAPDVVVIALPPITGPGVYGFIIVGLNPRTPFSNDYELFFRLVGDVLVNAITSMTLPQEQRQLVVAAEDAALKHASLLRQLAVKNRDVERSEARFTRMAQQAPLGLFILEPSKAPIYFNDAYKKMVGIDNEKSQNMSDAAHEKHQTWWRELVHPDDRALTNEAWETLLREKKQQVFEHRLTKEWKAVDPGTGTTMSGEYWVLVTLYPEINSDGSIETVMGWLAEISLQKWTQSMQTRRLEEAIESERQKEQYIDRTSHEIRNPLSAMLQAADAVVATLNEPAETSDKGGIRLLQFPADGVETMIDHAETIMLCINHQKRIVDDVLTLSKLDSRLLRLAPEPVDPMELAQQTLRMFDAELKDSEMHAHVESEMKVTEGTLVLLDPSRIQQILVNLVTNAIKFTKDCPERNVKITVSASTERPGGETNEMFLNPNARNEAFSEKMVQDVQDYLYILFKIEDTGAGLTPEEIERLFRRFEQGSERTYSKYGGSGLGLAISKELTELQGGRMGVSSEAGHGSTFSFYVRGARATDDIQPRKLAETHLTESSHSEARSRKEGSEDQATPAGEATQPVPLSATLEPGQEMHVLVVEDNEVNQRILAKQLRKAGCTVTTSDDGQQALDHINKTTWASRFDPHALVKLPLTVVLMDVHMPVLDGLQATTKIREMESHDELHGHIPIIAVTANARREQIDEALRHGMDAVVTKPFRIAELMRQIKTTVAAFETTQREEKEDTAEEPENDR